MRKSRKVYTSGVTLTDQAMGQQKRPVNADAGLNRGKQLMSVSAPEPSQKYTFQRGLAIAALNLPEPERISVLAEVLASMGLLERVMPRCQEMSR